ncbi:hypothetical protein LAZ40_11755 [Cereibacter sphaeroides]|uniref:hypothetical protein n=1 Tax=Cereibacter sphaeroides TaxID=1063 RepID=UPI001F3A48FC|nr:hypothetical protein [Cereibacter sphaeroides]MCE6959694.1 hypothetical protein [Cereibacter sphaeroides]MCE6974445.1 hypothetical protein [Cereibacter sphaeroides]
MNERSKDMQALMLLHLGNAVDVAFHKSGRTLRAPVAFRSQALVRDILKVGLFSMNVPGQDRAGEEGRSGFAAPALPSALLGLAFHYALEAAPRAEGAPEETIDLGDLESHVALIERYFGPIGVDMDLVARVSILAAGPAPSPGPSAGSSSDDTEGAAE